MPENGRKLAVIRNPKWGVDDIGAVSLRFSTYIAESTAADQRLVGEYAENTLRAAGVADVRDLDGRTCWVRVDRNLIVFERMAKL